jgi:NAD(P)-dependent dehydrogenase (short-subunit alcohol dehydrogenase family)
MLSRSLAKLSEAAKTIPGGRALALVMDMLDPDAVARVIGSRTRIDHLVLTAVADELASRAPIRALTPAQLERSFDKLRGFVNVTRAAVPLLARDGSITLLTGASAIKPPADGFSALAAASGALVSFGRALALELAPIRANVVMAGVVDTPIHGERREAMQRWAEQSLPVRRFGQPDDIAETILFAMTNAYLTGQTLTVDGGLTAM